MAKKSKQPLPPDDDLIYLYIENAFGMGAGADLRKGGGPLTSISNWIYRLFPEGGGLSVPIFVLTHPKTTGIILPVDVPGRDEEKIQHLLGLHDWDKFVNPQKSHAVARMGLRSLAGESSTVYVCTLQNRDDIATREFIEVDLLNKIVGYPEFIPGAYPAPRLPETAIPRSALHRELPAAPRPAPLLPGEFAGPVEMEEKKKQIGLAGHSAVNVVKDESKDLQRLSTLSTKQEDIAIEIALLNSQVGRSRDPTGSVKPDSDSLFKNEEETTGSSSGQPPSPMTKKEELAHEFNILMQGQRNDPSPLASSGGTRTKREELEHQIAILQRNAEGSPSNSKQGIGLMLGSSGTASQQQQFPDIKSESGATDGKRRVLKRPNEDPQLEVGGKKLKSEF